MSHRLLGRHDHLAVIGGCSRTRRISCGHVGGVRISPHGRLEWLTNVARERLASAVVTTPLNAGLQLGDAGLTRIVANRRRLGDGVAFDARDARLLRQCPLDDRLLTRQMHPACVQHGSNELIGGLLGGSLVDLVLFLRYVSHVVRSLVDSYHLRIGPGSAHQFDVRGQAVHGELRILWLESIRRVGSDA